MALFEVTAYDKKIYEEELKDFLPDKILDVHTHVWLDKFLEKKRIMEAAAAFINAKYGEGTVELTITDSYFNMRGCIEPVMYVVDRAKAAMRKVGMNPKEAPIRGGTDGARLSYEGLPCPNLCTGG